ncbi:MAG: MFS transporter [Sedimentisphaerales bacterium]|nr:MFS transporter [Sedimentisphaerales bacterium]
MCAVPDDILPTKKNAYHHYDTAVKNDYQHNAIIFTAFDFLWGLSLPFALYTTIVPAYMSELGAPKSLIGIIASLTITICPVQVITSHFFRKQSRKVWLMGLYISSVIPWTLYSFIFLCWAPAVSNAVKLIFFSICMLIFMAGCIGCFPLHFSLMTDCTPLKKRGTLYGYRVAAISLASILACPLAYWVTKHWNGPDSFLVAFIVGNIFRIISSTVILSAREHRDPRIYRDRKPGSKMNRLIPRTRLTVRKMLKNTNYRILLFFTIILFISMMMGSFIIVFAKETMMLTGAEIITFTIIQMLSAAFFSTILGKIGDKVGYKIIGVISTLLLSFGFMLVLLAATGHMFRSVTVYLGFILYSGVTSVAAMVQMNMSVELLPKINSGTLVALTNFLMMPAIFVSLLFSGLIIDLTSSYTIVFTIGALLSAISTVGFAVLVQEPRKRVMYVVRQVRKI